MNADVCYLNREALFCAETEDYRVPAEPEAGEEVILRFRTARGNVDQVLYRECGRDDSTEMRKKSSDLLFDYYECRITAGTEQVRYYFELIKGGGHCFYNRLGVQDDAQACFAFCITPGFHTPEWAKGAVMYQIYVDRFCNGDPSNDVETGEYIYIGAPVHGVKKWEKPLETMDVGYFYGGDLKGVWQKLDYLQRLGVEVIYFNPIFVSPSNHKYDCQDYEHIDPHYGVIVKDGGQVLDTADGLPDGGGEALRAENRRAAKYIARVTEKENLEASDAFFARFMEEVHKRGMKVILDGVFNHCGSFNKWLDREGIYEGAKGYEPGAYVSADSPYHTFFHFAKEG
ncbi:MAG: alpha amylase N-terminal ig-like domain-containing protein, partial [Lachnospiraceae bacterium]|nr:alpha amylase N-terminal ig-like domain-containing protein [Lachnospiraceae bacterium]